MRIGKPGTPAGRTTPNISPARRHGGRSRDQRAVRRRWLRQQARHRVRCHDRRLQAALGRLWQPAQRRQGQLGFQGPPPQQFTNPVHCITITIDGLVVVCDRQHNRMQFFRKDGTFVRETFVLKDSYPGTIGSIVKWPDAAQTISWSWMIRMASSTWSTRERRGGEQRRPGRPPARRVLQTCTSSASTAKATSTAPRCRASACRSFGMSVGCDPVPCGPDCKGDKE